MKTIEGQASLFLKDLKGKEYPAYAEVRRNKRVNGQREITVEFLPNIINVDFLQDIEFGWKVIFKGEEYTIITPAYKLDGQKGSVAIDAVLSFFVDLNGYYLQDSVEDKSMTPAAYFGELFNGTPYSYVLVDNLGANTLNYSENQSKTERFLYGIDRYKAEYKVQGKVAYIYDLVGHDKDIILHDDLNVQDATVEVDGSGFHTYAKGYGDLDEETGEYNLETEWESPLIAKYGKIEGPALYDGSFKHEPALKGAVKKRVENSYKVSTTITPIDLTNNGYPEMRLEEGDRVYLHIDRLGLNQQVRVMEIEETFDVEGNITSAQYTLGNESIATRYKTQQYNTLKDFGDIINGHKKIKTSWLDDAVKRASDIINGNLDSHFSYGAGEIIGINRSDPNGYMRFNTDGIGFSRDGGKTYRTAITYEGIVADAITAGTLRGILIEGVEIRGGILQSLNNSNTFWDLETGKLEMEDANFYLGGGALIEFLSSGNRIRYTRNNRHAGIAVGTSINNTYPFVAMGATNLNQPFNITDDAGFSGFIANTKARTSEDSIGNSAVGNVFHVRDKAVNFTKGFVFDLQGNDNYRIRPMYSGNYSYWLGGIDNQFTAVYTGGIRTSDGFLSFRNSSSSYLNQGFRMDTTYDGDDQLYFRGIHSDDYHSLGRPGGWRFRNLYLRYQPDVSSDERLKTGIKEIDRATEIIDAIKPIQYRYKLSNKDLELKNQGNMERGLNINQYGFSAQQVKNVLDDLGIESQSLVNLGEDNYYGMQTTQVIPLLVKAFQEEKQRNDELEARITQLEQLPA